MKITNNYELTINVKQQDGNTYWYDTKSYKIDDREFNVIDFYQLWDKFEFYDDYGKKELNKIFKKSGAITAIGISLIALITGLNLRLKRSGNNVVVNPSKKASKLKPRIPVKREEQWVETKDIAKKTTGDGLIFIGDHIYLIIGALVLYISSKK